jgi:UDP-2,3-diacylglucosamine pyrophosphatase LpxH
VDRLIIADAHLGQRAGDTTRMAELLGHAAARRVGEVVFLGDVCHYLIGMEKFWTSPVRATLASWRELRTGGTRLVVVEGNRDFFLDAADLAPYLDWQGRSYEFSAGGRRFRLVHGDRVNRDDLQYRFWAAISKSAVARLWAQLLPRPVANRIVISTERALARSNWRYRHRLPVAHLRAQAEAAWREGVDEIVWGHFHEPWSWSRDGRRARVLPAWLGSEESLLVAADGASVTVDASLTPVVTAPDNGPVDYGERNNRDRARR